MVASVEQLKGLFSAKNGVARPNLFTVSLPRLPGASAASSELNLLCRDVTLPGRQILSYDREIGTKREKIAYGSATDDVTMSFLVLNDYGVKRYFEQWQKLAYDPATYQIGYKSDYAKQITINQMKKGFGFPLLNKQFPLAGLPTSVINRLPNLGPINFAQQEFDLDFLTSANVIYTCTLEDAWPTTVEGIALNNELDGLIELRVSITYTRWYSNFNQQSQTSDLTNLAIGSILTNITK